MSRVARRLAILVLLLSALLSSLPADEKRISIYSNAANYSVAITQQAGRDYVGLLEVLDPLGRVSAHADGKRWNLRYEQTTCEFTDGSTHVGVNTHDFDLGAVFSSASRIC